MSDTEIVLSDNELNKLREVYTPSITHAEAQKNYTYDFEKFLKFSSVTKISSDPVALEAILTHAYHALEKGLTMEVPRPWFWCGCNYSNDGNNFEVGAFRDDWCCY